MTKIIGPISFGDWRALVLFNQSIKEMKSRTQGDFKVAIEKETRIYYEILNPYLNAANDNTLLTEAA